MSVILKALKSSETESKVQNNGFSIDSIPEGEGFFKGRQAFIKKKKMPVNLSMDLKPNKRAYVLAAVFILLVILSLTLKWVSSSRMTAVSEDTKVVDVQPGGADTGAGTDDDQQAKAVSEGVVMQASQAFNSGDYDASIRLFKEAISIDQNNSKLHNNLGLAFTKKELYASAEDEFKTALELDTSCSECFNNLGMLKSVLGESIEAKKYLEKAISLASSYPDPYFNLAVLSEKEGDYSNAVKYYRQFTSLYPDKNDVLVTKINRRIADLADQ
jgi:Tfp pilus assembly protein PilF